MGLNIKRFVNIDIKPSTLSTVISTRDTVALFVTESGTDAVYSSYSALAATEKNDTTKAYAKIYFDNGGIKLAVYHSAGTDATALAKKIAALSNDIIVVAYTGEFTVLNSVAVTRKTGSASNIDAIYGVNEKILVGRMSDVSKTVSAADNLAIKYSSIVGAEMTIAAYLCQIDVYKADSVHDYAFTAETIAAEDIDDATYGKIITANWNVATTLASAVRNLGGNLVANAEGYAYDIVNQYVRIILQQTVTDRVLAILTSKVKGNSGVSAIYTAIANELNKYVSNGYLATDKTYDGTTKTISKNGVTYTLIENGTALTTGYHLTVLPLTSLSSEDIAAHKCPDIYLYIADSYGIRTVTIQGEVI